VREVRVHCCLVGPDFWCQRAYQQVIVPDTVVLHRGWISPVVYSGFHRSLEYGGGCSRFFCNVYGVPVELFAERLPLYMELYVASWEFFGWLSSAVRRVCLSLCR